MTGDIECPVILVSRGRALPVLVLEMESGPNAAVSIAVAYQRYFFRRYEGDAERVENEYQLAVFFPLMKAVK